MTETLRIDEEQGYVDLEVVGALDAEAMRAQIQRVMEAAEGVRFVETAAMNSGLAMRIFEDRERGLEWLLAKT